MTLLIGCMLIYHFDLPWWWYLISAAWYAMEWQKHHEYHTSLYRRIVELETRLTGHPRDPD